MTAGGRAERPTPSNERFGQTIMANIIQDIEAAQKKADVPSFRGGDTLRVHVKVVEGGKERIQVFEGVGPLRQVSGNDDDIGC